MVYLDQPVGTGFSYGSEALLTTMEAAGDEFEYWLM
jgi:carboxypeptidase C (cathepsin A)